MATAPQLLTVRVIPRAGRSAIDGVRDGAVVVRLSAAPVDGAANDELIELLAGALNLPRRAVTIVQGERGRLKQVRLDGIDSRVARERLLAR